MMSRTNGARIPHQVGIQETMSIRLRALTALTRLHEISTIFDECSGENKLLTTETRTFFALKVPRVSPKSTAAIRISRFDVVGIYSD